MFVLLFKDIIRYCYILVVYFKNTSQSDFSADVVISLLSALEGIAAHC